MKDKLTTADGIRMCFISPNERDANLEEANVVDGLFAIARALNGIGKKLENLEKVLTKQQ